jgi:hypothetical protein
MGLEQAGVHFCPVVASSNPWPRRHQFTLTIYPHSFLYLLTLVLHRNRILPFYSPLFYVPRRRVIDTLSLNPQSLSRSNAHT